MPKKKKKTKSKRKFSKKRRKKIKRRSPKKRKFLKRKKKLKKKIQKKTKEKNDSTSSELIFKTKPEWVKSSLANKAQYHKKYNDSIKNNNAFGKKKEKELLG